jgi:hypothetical protein
MVTTVTILAHASHAGQQENGLLLSKCQLILGPFNPICTTLNMTINTWRRGPFMKEVECVLTGAARA